ncbi:MAG TPA: SPOR domain-containing protein [Burkholderiaceae bacterium]|jgi:DedD protein|nr:SPOR domain-containing protein [Burkholderiaceae bacterium]HQR70004.1 SPOR domain-containing protein [Burkholderiaceae bacterium]
MSLAFWRRKTPPTDATGSGSSRSTSNGDDPAAALRARARRRLIGAAALLLLAVIVVPMVLDPEPKPLADNIPIDIPSEKSKFSPRLALPPVPAPENVLVAPPPDAPPAAVAAPASSSTTNPPAAPKTSEAKNEESKSRPAAEAKTSADRLPAPAKGGKFAVQAAATSTEAAARDLSERLKKAGLAPYTERVETADGTRFRVRVGPYASRDDAERVRARLKSLGINANVVS